MSFSVVPDAGRNAPGTSVVSGTLDAMPTFVSSPVLLVSEKVVTVPCSSLRAYRNLLSRDVMKWRGPAPAFMRKTAGVFEVSRPDFASNANRKIWSVPSVGTYTNLLVSLERIECALRPTGITCSGSAATRPSRPTALTLTRCPPYDAPNRNRPVLSSERYGKLSASGELANG